MRKLIILLTALLLFSMLWSKSIVKIKNITVKGKIVTSSNKPIKGASITIGEKTARSNYKGKFSIKTKVMRSYRIIIKHQNYESITINRDLNKPNEKTFDVGKITLMPRKKYGKIKGKILDDKGKPVPFANVVVIKWKLGTQTDKEGKFTINNVPIGIHELTVSRIGYGTQKITNVKIKNNKITIINSTLKKNNAISITGTSVREAKEEYEEDKGGSNPLLGEPKLRREDRKTAEAELKDIEAKLNEDDDIEVVDRIGETALPDKFLIKEGGRKNETAYSTDGISASNTGSASTITATPTSKKHYKKGLTTPEASGKASIPSVYKPKKSGLKASFVDDNKQFNYFLHFLEKYKNRAKHFNLNINNRFIITFTDAKGNTLPDVSVSVSSLKGKLLVKGRTYSNGTFMFFPSALSQLLQKQTKFKLVAEYNQGRVEKTLDIQDPHNLTFKIANTSKRIPKKPPLDILFVLDTTGSMGEEIHRLINTIELINMNLMEFSPKPDIRFGMILFKDKRDNYITKIIPFTKNLPEFSKTLSRVSASGGGDKPEDLQAALRDAVKNVEWSKNGVKAAFVITDAPPHLNYLDQKYRYVDAAKDAKQAGIKIFTIGTGGLDINGEYVLRQISQFTSANYIFLTYGEKGENEGGKIGSVSHHTGENFKTDKLEAIIIQLLKKELRLYTGKEIVADEYIEANPIDDEKNEETLDKLFSMALSQLYDYSSVKIAKKTSTAIAPFMITANSQKATAEYFYQNLELVLSKNDKFKAVERKDLQPVLDELKFQLDDLSNQNNAAELGKFMGAKLLITAKIFEKNDHYEIFLKLLNVETVEILSITKLKINKKLGL